MKSHLYLEITKAGSGQSFLFTKRINVNKGAFPTHYEVFPERFKRRIGGTPSMTLHEAGVQAQQRSHDIEHLQSVSLRDKAGRTNTTKDLVIATNTWLWFNGIEQLSEIHSLSSRRTKDGESAANTLAILEGAVKAFYAIEGEGYTHKSIYTAFGDHLLGVLNSGQAGNLFSEAVPLWAQQTNRGHLKATDKTIHDATRFVKIFNDFAGDRPIDQITRSKVAEYIESRCKSVKTTSVCREVNILRAVWNKAADALDINSRNPFIRQTIHGLGTDADRRHTPSLEEHQNLMRLLTEHPRKHESYVIPMLAVIALTGLRLSEAWGIQIKDYIQDKKLLLVRPNISDRAAKVQIQRQMSTLLDKCKNLGPITGEAIANEKAWSLDRGVQQAEANGRDKVAELGGDTFVVLNTDEYYGIAFSSKNKTVVQGVAMRCY